MLQDYTTTLRYETNRPCDWRRAISLQHDPASAQSRLDFIPHPFSLAASSSTKQPPSDELRERQDRLIKLTGKTPLVLLPSTLISLHTLCTMNCMIRQACISPRNEKMVQFCGNSISRGISTTPKLRALKRIEDELHDVRQSQSIF